MLVLGVAHEPGRRDRRWNRLDQRDCADRLRMDRRQQQHELANGHRRSRRQRQWNRQLLRGRKYELIVTQRNAVHRWSDVYGHASRSAVHVLDFADRAGSRCRWHHQRRDGDGNDRVCVDGRQQQSVVVDGHQRNIGER